MHRVLITQSAIQLEMSNRLLKELAEHAGEITKERIKAQMLANQQATHECDEYMLDHPFFGEEVAAYRKWVRLTNPATPEADHV